MIVNIAKRPFRLCLLQKKGREEDKKKIKDMEEEEKIFSFHFPT